MRYGASDFPFDRFSFLMNGTRPTYEESNHLYQKAKKLGDFFVRMAIAQNIVSYNIIHDV